MGLRSEDYAGHIRTLKSLSWNHFLANFKVCLGLLSAESRYSLSNGHNTPRI